VNQPNYQAPCTDEVCITCSDEGRPGILVAWSDNAFEPGIVRTDAGTEPVDMTLVPGASIGDRLLIHAGVAITALTPDDQPFA